MFFDWSCKLRGRFAPSQRQLSSSFRREVKERLPWTYRKFRIYWKSMFFLSILYLRKSTAAQRLMQEVSCGWEVNPE